MNRRSPAFIAVSEAPPTKEIQGATRYRISSSGVCLSIISNPGTLRVRHPWASPSGYLAVRLSFDDGVIRTQYIHHLVAAAWLGVMPPGCECVRHLDGNRLNNKSENLAYGTHAQNNKDKEAHGTGISGERNPCAVLSRRQVAHARSLIAEGVRQRKIAKLLSVSPMTISRIANHQTWRTA